MERDISEDIPEEGAAPEAAEQPREAVERTVEAAETGAPRGRGPSDDQEGRPRQRGRFRRRVCAMCANKMPYVDYKDFSFLRRFVSDRGRIEGRRKAGTCSKHQRALARAIKRARHLALLPYSPEHVRGSGVGQHR